MIKSVDRRTKHVDNNGPSTVIRSGDVEMEAGLLEDDGSGHTDLMGRPFLHDSCEESKPEPAHSASERKLCCRYCPRTFKFQSQLIVHERIHTGEKPFSCPECGKRFTKKSNLNLHLKVHRKNKTSIQCSFCPKKIAHSDYFTHMKTHRANVVEISQNSKQCQLLKTTSESSKINPQRCAPNKALIKQSKILCQYCEKDFRFQSALVRHVRVHTGEKPYKCDICSKAFGQAYFLRVHELTHWSVKRYNCTRCGKAFVHYSNATKHSCRPKDDCEVSWKLLKPSLTFTCHICRNVFDKLQLFKSHMKEHTGAQLYHCLKCDKLFGVFAKFNAHKKGCIPSSHFQPAQLQQDEGLITDTLSVTKYQGFKRYSDYNTAQSPNVGEEKDNTEVECKTPLTNRFFSAAAPERRLSHIVSCLNNLDNRSDPRKYFCPNCGRLFRHMGRLRAHMLTHKRDQRYCCTCCGKTLENWKKLWLHQRIHRQRRGRFSCPLCGRGFRFVERYKRHMSEHPDFQWVPIGVKRQRIIVPFKCEQCMCKFRSRRLLFNHQPCHVKHQENLPSSKSTFISVSQSIEKKLFSNNCSSAQVKQKACKNSHQAPVTDSGNQTQSLSYTNNSREGSSKCTICARTCSATLDLYLHYLQHARGELT